MIINSTRFGPVEVSPEKMIRMERPLLGFESLRNFCLIENDELTPFLLLQSAEDPVVGFLVVNPRIFFPNYRIEINSNEIAELDVSDVNLVETYVIVTVPEDPHKMSVNLQGPILINSENRLAKQLVLVNSDYRVKHFLMRAIDRLQLETVREEELVGV